jgi:hypothetical protein
MPDISEDSAIFGIITAFPGCNPDFMLGFEAGMVWGQLWSGRVSGQTPSRVQHANRRTLDRVKQPGRSQRRSTRESQADH